MQYCSQYDYRINGYRKKGKQHPYNSVLIALRKYNLINNKHIPLIYKTNSRENRLKLLAGIIDSDGYYNAEGNLFEITQSKDHENLFDDIIYLSRSLGFSCYKREKKTSWYYKGEKKTSIAYRCHIGGKAMEEIPTLIPRKKARPFLQIKDPMNSGITVTPKGEDTYYGFMIDGNCRFVLGNFIVTHNTAIVRKGLANALNRPLVSYSCGGMKDSAFLQGFSFTYSGSRYGRIAQGLMESGVMNPILFFDELDKISDNSDGREITNMLIHMTDPSQNFDYEDKYFDGIRIDLSKVVFVFSYNDANLIRPVSKDSY